MLVPKSFIEQQQETIISKWSHNGKRIITFSLPEGSFSDNEITGFLKKDSKKETNWHFVDDVLSFLNFCQHKPMLKCFSKLLKNPTKTKEQL